MTKTNIALGLAAILLAPCPAPAQVSRLSSPSDEFGYTLLDQSAAECSYNFIDIQATGTPVSFTAASGSAPADDDGGALIVLAEGFELYGMPVTSVVMSTNGYLAATGGLAGDHGLAGDNGLAGDDGGDFSNDAVLPAVPGEEDLTTLGDEPRANGRIMVYHDDLSAIASGGTAQHQYFASCPRPGDSAGNSGLEEPCSVFQWSDWGFAGSSDIFSFQALLYHTSLAIVFQVGTGDSAAGASATLGIQDTRCDVALQHRASAPAETALCFFEPRFPAGGPVADLQVELTAAATNLIPGDTVEYTIVVSHFEGPSPVTGATVSDVFPASLTNCGWTCTPEAGSTCAAAGSGDIADTVTLPVDGVVTYVATCTVDASASGSVSNTAAVAVPAGFTDPDSANDSVSKSNSVFPASSLIFRDGFETGDLAAW